MLTRLQSLQSSQIEAALSAWRAAKLPARPAQGWVRAIREALGMPANVYAQKLSITSGGLASLEKAEANQTITLASLHKLADALGCELQYALVPRQSLQEQLRARAAAQADAQLRPIAHSIALEDQAVQGQARQLQREMLIQELLTGSRRKLWAIDRQDVAKPEGRQSFNALVQLRRESAAMGNSIEVNADDL